MTKITEKQKAEYEARRKMLRRRDRLKGGGRATLKLIKGKPKLAKKGW
jgi:hypothetical protein